MVNSYERIMATVAGQEPDRMPIMDNWIAPQVMEVLAH